MSRDTRMDPSPLRNSICDACQAVTTHKDGNCIPCIERGIALIKRLPTFDIQRDDKGVPHMVFDHYMRSMSPEETNLLDTGILVGIQNYEYHELVRLDLLKQEQS